MSGDSAQAAAASAQSQWQGRLSQEFGGIALPELRRLMGSSGLSGMLSSMDASGRMAPDAAIRSSSMQQLNQGYGQAQMGSREAIQYGALRSGEGRLSPGATGSAITSAATSLDRDRTSALRNLEFMSAQSSLQDYNQVLQLLGQGSKSALGLGGGFGNVAGQAIGGLSSTSTLGGIMAGASTGQSLGSIFGPYGAAIGGVVGGISGGFSAGG